MIHLACMEQKYAYQWILFNNRYIPIDITFLQPHTSFAMRKVMYGTKICEVVKGMKNVTKVAMRWRPSS